MLDPTCSSRPATQQRHRETPYSAGYSRSIRDDFASEFGPRGSSSVRNTSRFLSFTTHDIAIVWQNPSAPSSVSVELEMSTDPSLQVRLILLLAFTAKHHVARQQTEHCPCNQLGVAEVILIHSCAIRRSAATNQTLMRLRLQLALSTMVCMESDKRAIVSILPVLLAATGVSAQEWTRFRGPNGSGVSQVTTVPAEWTEQDYNWRIALPGVGHSSPVLWGDLLVVTTGDEATGGRLVIAVDAADGKERWRFEFEAHTHRKHKLNSFASATPAIDDRSIYTAWATPKDFVILALDHYGEEQWRVDLGPFKTGHGGGVSPIVHDGLVVIQKDHEGDSELIALDCAGGETQWRVPRKSHATWATPCVLDKPEGESELVFVSWTRGITAVDPRTGAVRWETDVFDKRHLESTIASPIVVGDMVLGVSGYLSVRQEVIAVRPRANGKDIERLYTIDRGVPLTTTPLAVDDLLFLWADEGIVTCADINTGKLHWRKRVGGTYYASPVVAGGRVYNVSADGEVVVLAADREYRLLARNSLGESSHSTPAIAGGVMYLRTFSQMFSIGGPQQGE